MVFIFDECHRSQFGENHKAIKEFFPNAQLFGFTGTPIFDDNATQKTREEDHASNKKTKDIFEKELLNRQRASTLLILPFGIFASLWIPCCIKGGI